MPTTEELAADLAAVKASTPTLEEQLFTFSAQCWNNGVDKLTTANAITMLIAPIPLRILSVTLTLEYGNIPASNTSYWTATLSRGNTAGYTAIATRTTQNTGGNANGALTARKAWTFDAAAWDVADLQAGDLLRLTLAPTGSPDPWDLPMTVTGRYRAL